MKYLYIGTMPADPDIDPREIFEADSSMSSYVGDSWGSYLLVEGPYSKLQLQNQEPKLIQNFNKRIKKAQTGKALANAMPDHGLRLNSQRSICAKLA
jgi:hypothetical protein